jgi:hypothetical protein
MAIKRIIADLQKELAEQVGQLPAFSQGAFSVFNLDDFKEQVNLHGTRVVGVSYDGAVPGTGHQATSVAPQSGNATLAVMQFSVVIAMQYAFAGLEDPKPESHNLLDELRFTLSGFKGINNRPWVWAGEKPEDVQSGDGLIFYSQAWRTSVAMLGQQNN